jgi:hypothetical protein
MMYVCSKCGGTNVQLAAWVNPNTEEVFDDYGSWNHQDTKWCGDCEEHVLLVLKEDENGKDGGAQDANVGHGG